MSGSRLTEIEAAWCWPNVLLCGLYSPLNLCRKLTSSVLGSVVMKCCFIFILHDLENGWSQELCHRYPATGSDTPAAPQLTLIDNLGTGLTLRETNSEVGCSRQMRNRPYFLHQNKCWLPTFFPATNTLSPGRHSYSLEFCNKGWFSNSTFHFIF